MQQQLSKASGFYLAEKAIKDSDIWALDADLADSNGAEAFANLIPERFIACGIAEQNMVSIAAGMASVNIRPWVYSFSAFLCYRAYDQIRVGVSQTNLPVTLIGSHSGGCGGRNGKTHLALNDIALMASLPNMSVWAPADVSDTRLAVDSILKINSPAYVRFPREHLSSIPEGEGEVRWIGQPTEVALISYGLSTHWALEAQELLRQQGIELGILHFCKIWPISKCTLDKLLKGVQHAFVLEDHYAYGGLATCLQLQGFQGEIINWAWPSFWSGQSGKVRELLAHCKRLPSDLVQEIARYLD